MNYSNELEENNFKEKLSEEAKTLKESEEYKMIGRKRHLSRNEKSAPQMHNGEGGQEDKKSPIEVNIPKLAKKKSKKVQKEYVVPQRVPWKSSDLLSSILDRIILKFDPLLILRGYRSKLKEDPQFNNFATRRIEKLINSQDNNSSIRLKIDFSKNKFNLEINKYLIENAFISFGNLNASEAECTNYEQPKTNSLNSQNESVSLNVSHGDIKVFDSNYQTEIEKLFDNKYVDTNLVDNVDILKYKLECNYYLSIEDFLIDCNFMFTALQENINNLLSRVEDNREAFMSYLTTIYLELIKQTYSVKKDFIELLDKDIKTIILNNKLPKIVSSFKNIPQKKEYQTISEYEHIFPEITKDKIKTELKPSCKGGCCDSYEDLGPLNLEKGKWDSKCHDRENNLECDPAICGCGDNCKNMDIRKRISKKLNEDVVEKYAWGIDLFTYRNLMEFLPMNFDDNYKKDTYIEKHLIKALNDQETEGHSITRALESLSKRTECADQENKLSDHLMKVFRESDAAATSSSTVYSKGIGIFCRKKEGIKQNELISIYLGEIYPPWYWYEKQDLIKKNKLDKELPDFYNIMLERLKRDARGYDLVMVDPNSKGNFASRMSHSCVPNCNTVLMCSNEAYQIGMFATKDISYGDELTFDYNSVTEKEKEFQDAICLCSSFECRGHYLIYSNSVLFTEVLSTYHSFLHRNAILLHACDPNFEENRSEQLLPADEDLLKEYSIGSSILGNAPFWVKKWAVLTLRFVKVESHLLPQMLSQEQKKPKKDVCQFITEGTKIKSEESKSNGSIKVTKPIKKNTCESVTSKEKYNFNKSNFIYPGLKSYQSSTRGKKQKIEEIKTDVEEIQSHSEKVIEIVREQVEMSEENKQDLTQEHTTSNLGIKNNNQIELSNGCATAIEEAEEKLNNLVPKLEENNNLENAIAKNGITENRIQNIAITIDKVLHVLKLMKINDPPLDVLSQKEIWYYYWGKEDSIRENLERNLKYLEKNSELFLIKDRIISIINTLKYDKFETSNLTEEDYRAKNRKIRETFKSIAIKIKVCSAIEKSGHYVFYEGLADMLYLYASTETYFKSNKNYQSCNSEKISIRKRDINIDLPTESLDDAVCHGEKSYDKLYIWGQLIGWFKQTVDKPNASLSAERRGSLSYPEIDSFFLSNINFGKRSKELNCFNYPGGGTRKGFYEKLIETPSMMWPVGNEWSYKNKNKIYGTIQFDSMFKLKETENVEASTLYLIDTLKRMEDSFNNIK